MMTEQLRRCPTIAVIGAGFCGTLTAIHLLRAAAPGTRIMLLDREAAHGRGVAYATTDPQHRLNVAAARMSAFCDEPGDFARWAGAGAADFLPRRRYGDYITARLDEAEVRSPAVLERRHAEVVDARLAPAGVELTLAGGARASCDRAVLAAGWLGGPSRLELPEDPRVIRDVWPALAAPAPRRGITVLAGTGPTAIDVALTLCRDPGARVIAVSRHGRLPFAHLPGLRTPAPAPPTLTVGRPRLEAAERALRRHAAVLRPYGFDWRDVVDGVRPLVPGLWAGFPLEDRRRFIAERARAWEIRRHRLAPVVAERVARLRATGRLTVLAGGLGEVRPARAGLDVTLGPDGRSVRAGALLDCTGAGATVDATHDPLVRGLLARGLAHPDALGIGLRTAPDGALPGTGGRLWTLGPLRRGERWESTAVPELRAQAAEVAAATLASLAAPARAAV